MRRWAIAVVLIAIGELLTCCSSFERTALIGAVAIAVGLVAVGFAIFMVATKRPRT